MTDKPQEPRDLIQICTDIYYECETIKRLDELTDEALDWHNKQTEEAMARFSLKKGVKYDVMATDSVVVITPANKLKETD